MSWVLWLAAPVAPTVLVAVWVGLRGRAPRALRPAEAMQAHRDYLDALGAAPRGRRRVEPAEFGPTRSSQG